MHKSIYKRVHIFKVLLLLCQPVLHELVNDPDGLQTLVWGLLSSHVKSRITSIEVTVTHNLVLSHVNRGNCYT